MPDDRRDSDRFDDALRACEDALRRAQLTGDAAALDRLVDDTLLFTGPDGRVYGKGDDLEAHRQGWVRITRLEASDERVRRMGQVAVVSVRMEMAGTFKGRAFAGPYRYTRVWREGPGGWRIVAGHVSAVLGDASDGVPAGE
jgi:ketosteroid isomerase-like protein